MSTLELKRKLLSRIRKTDNKRLLREMFGFFEIESKTSEIYQLTAEQKKSILKAQKEIKKGNFLPEEQANREIEEWLKE